MDAIKFIQERNRMCKFYGNCFKCPSGRIDCCDCISLVSEELVEIVEKWSNEHPQKTRLQDFKEKYPNAHVSFDGTPNTCCSVLGYCETCEHTYNANCRACWNEPV